MLSVHLEKGIVEVREIPQPTRPEGFAVIRLLLAGICNTDLELQHGYYGFAGTPGHEFVGKVVAADTQSLVGKRVVGEINLNCGNCSWCARGLGRHCPTRTVLGIVRHPGAFQEFLTLPERNLHVVPDSISDEEAVFVEPLAAACEILDQVPLAAGDEVAVLGDGKLGLLIAQGLHSHGCLVRQFGRHPGKLRISQSRGIDTAAAGTEPAKAFRYVVDATGSPEGLKTAVRMTEPRGTIILKSTIHGEVPIDTAPVIVDELTLVGSRCGRFEPAIELLRSRAVDVKPLISERMELSDAARAFDFAAQRGVLKVLLAG
ncbi:MAG TPA: alcohol dehydrogenase catalytic domain-containing protein [Bryobacteraceae bacterium]|nr:alcohol dehydrogenase catalytic domain-containing protein [Bryobacteraceae bacterium]